MSGVCWVKFPPYIQNALRIFLIVMLFSTVLPSKFVNGGKNLISSRKTAIPFQIMYGISKVFILFFILLRYVDISKCSLFVIKNTYPDMKK